MSTLNTCGCGASWAARTWAHCGGCHATFSGITTFDAHRRGGTCLAPADVGLELRNGAFRGPQLDGDVLARLGRT